jgi:hypothetical protein
MSTYSIIPATPADLPTISSFVNISKQPLVINRLLWKDWPNEENQKAQCVRAVEGAWKDPLSETFKVIEDESGEIVGHLVLSKIEGKTAEAKGEEGSGPEGDGEKKTEENGKEGGMPEGLVPEVATAVGEATQKIGKDLEGVEHFSMYLAPVIPIPLPPQTKTCQKSRTSLSPFPTATEASAPASSNFVSPKRKLKGLTWQ